MNLVPYRQYDPFAEMSRMLDNMRNLMSRSLVSDWGWLEQPSIYQLAVDVAEDDKNVIVRTSIPGVNSEDVDISVTGDILTIAAESRDERTEERMGWHVRELHYGKFSRSVRLPAEVNADRASAEMENGILTITLPKAHPGPVQKIAVKAKKLLSGKKE